MRLLKLSTAVTELIGPFVDDTDGKTDEGALVIKKADVHLSKNGGSFAAANADQGTADAGAPYDSHGYYSLSLNTTDTGTLGRLKVMIPMSGALKVWTDFMVVPANVYDALVGGTDKLQVDVAEWLGTAVSASNLSNAAFLSKVVKNKKALVKSGQKTYLQVYDDDGTTVILKKELLDLDGNPVSDLVRGQLASEKADEA